jgi:hypothetical protein
MKFTVKNRPETVFHNSAFAEWFEGFEKQLRKELRDMYRSAETKQLIKEILGDEP